MLFILHLTRTAGTTHYPTALDWMIEATLIAVAVVNRALPAGGMRGTVCYIALT